MGEITPKIQIHTVGHELRVNVENRGDSTLVKLGSPLTDKVDSQFLLVWMDHDHAKQLYDALGQHLGLN